MHVTLHMLVLSSETACPAVLKLSVTIAASEECVLDHCLLQDRSAPYCY